MPSEDREIAELVQTRFSTEGIVLHLATQVTNFELNYEEGHRALLQKDGTSDSIAFDAVLLALGRRARTQGMGLEELGIELAPEGNIAHNQYMQTNIPNMYTCGDATGPFQFTHAAGHQAWYATVNALFSPFKKFAVNQRVIPRCTFIDPELSRVGLNE